MAASAPTASESASAAPASVVLTPQQQEWMDDPQGAFELGVELAFERWEDLSVSEHFIQHCCAWSRMSVEHGWCGGTEVGEQLRDELIDATIDWFYSAKEKLHWDEVSEFLFDALSEQFHVQSETREEERIARLLTTLYADCLERKDFTGLQRLMDARRQVFKARAEATRKVKQELAEDEDEDGEDEEEWDGEEGDVEHDEGKASGERGLEQRLQRMTVAEGKEEEDSNGGEGDEAKDEKVERTAEEDDGWTTVGGKPKGKKKGR